MGNKRSETCDVVVVGGGPGGSTVSTFIADQGHKVLLLERERFPRHQIGESLLPATIHGVCKLLGVTDELAAANFVVKRGGHFRWGTSRKPWVFDFTHHKMLEKTAADFAYQVERSKFDEILLRNAERRGVLVREECQVTGALRENERTTGVTYKDKDGQEYEIHAKYVVDASGHGSLLASLAGERRYSEFFKNIAIYAYYENGKRSPPPHEGNITCASFDKGWFWYIPLSDTLTSVGAVVGRDHAEELKTKDHEAVFQGLIDRCELIKDYLAPASRVAEGIYAPIRIRKDWSYTTDKFWSPGLALIGDAACFIDPVFSSGVHLATYAGLLAARSINTCLKGDVPEEDCWNEFEARYRREFRVFYEFLLQFYDLNQNEDSYFWSARKVLGTEEASNEAFIRLVAGAGTTGSDFFAGRAEARKQDSELRKAGVPREKRPAMMALRAEGISLVEMAFDKTIAQAPGRELQITPDGMHWMLPS